MQVLLACLLVIALLILVIGGVLQNSPEGYEDDTGYHPGCEHHPNEDGHK